MQNLFKFLSIILFFVALSSCDKDSDDIIDPNPNLPESQRLTKIEGIDENGSYIIFSDTTHYVNVCKLSDSEQLAIGHFDSDEVSMLIDEQSRPTRIQYGDLTAGIIYSQDKAVITCSYKNIMFCDTISVDESNMKSSRASIPDIMLNIGGWALGFGASHALDNMAGGLPISWLASYLSNVDDMTPSQTINYQLDVYENWPAYLAEYVSGIPGAAEWLKNWWKERMGNDTDKARENKKAPTIILGLTAGNAPYIYNTYANCLVDGYLYAEANDGEFNFDYGICYSEEPIPTIDNKTSRTNVSSGLISSFTAALPQKFVLEDLKPNTKYYYRVFYYDNKDKLVVYSENIRSFTTSDIPAAISSLIQTNSYHNGEGYSHNGKIYGYKYMISLKADLESFDDIMDWGYYYINEDGNRVAYSLMNRNSLRCDDILEYYDNSSNSHIDVGCYVKYKSTGDKAFYSDPISFDLEYNDEVKLSFIGCNYIEMTHDDSMGYYRCGVTFDVSFSIQGAEKLTSVIVVPFGNFLSWNCKAYTNPTDGDFTTRITDQYIYEYGLYGNFYCFLLGKDIEGKEYYSDNIVRLYHDGYHFVSCEVASFESLSSSTRSASRSNNVLRH